MIDIKTIQLWRNMARAYSKTSLKKYDLEQELRQRYDYWKTQSSDPHLQFHNIRLAWAGIGLMTFGNASVIEDVLLNIPPRSSHEEPMRRFIADVIVTLLPVSERLKKNHGSYMREHPDEMLAWFYEHQDRLVWDENLNQFVLCKPET